MTSIKRLAREQYKGMSFDRRIGQRSRRGSAAGPQQRKEHSHARENARRLRQLAKGMLKA